MQNKKKGVGEFLKKKWEVKLMYGEYSGIVCVRRLLVKKVLSYGY
jgi:hypothetical protein